MTTLWYPKALKHPLPDAGPFTGGKPKILHHTTEGDVYPGPSLYEHPDGTTQPHFTCDHVHRVIYQHVALNRASKGLMHPAGTGETNHDNVIQIEHLGHAATSGQWSKGDYAFIAELCRWIEGQTGCPRSCGVSFSHPKRFAWNDWHRYAGHCGHVHAPSNFHVDPGYGFRIDLVLGSGSKPTPRPAGHPTVKLGDKGETVHHLQSSLRALGYKIVADAVFGRATERAVKDFQARHHLSADGICGAKTWAAIHSAITNRRN